MAANITPIFPLAARIETQIIENADSTNKKMLFSAGSNGSRLNTIGVNSSDTAAMTVGFYLSKDSGSTFSLLGTISVSAAFNGPIHSGISCFDSSNGIAIPSGSSIYVAVASAVTSGKALNFSALGSDY